MLLKRTFADHMNSAVWMIVALIWMSGEIHRGDSAWLCLWSVALILYSLELGFSLAHPEIEIKNELVCFRRKRNFRLFRTWACLSMDEIAEIREEQREVGGFAKMIRVPTFIFRMQDGKEIEYFPGRKQDKRLDEIRSFFDGAGSLPKISPREDIALGARSTLGRN